MTVRWRLMISCSFNVKLYLKVHTLHLWEDSLVMPLIIRTAGMCLYYIFKRTHGSTLSQTFLKWRTTFALCKHRLQKALSEKPIISSMLLLVTIFFFFEPRSTALVCLMLSYFFVSFSPYYLAFRASSPANSHRETVPMLKGKSLELFFSNLCTASDGNPGLMHNE